MPDKKLRVWTDGGARGNPGPAAAGIVIMDETQTLWQSGVFLGDSLSNNQAEYLALQLGIEKATELGATVLEVRMDSQLVVEQINLRYKVKDAGLRQRWELARQSLETFTEWHVMYVPRAENSQADRLVNEALDAR